MCNSLLGLHAFTGCDSDSSFKGIGNIKTLKVLLKSSAFYDALKQLGEEWETTDDLMAGCESFTCAVYGKAKYSNVDEVHYIMLKAKCDGDALQTLLRQAP